MQCKRNLYVNVMYCGISLLGVLYVFYFPLWKNIGALAQNSTFLFLLCQLLSQLGPDYRGSIYIEKLVQRCEQWCEECSFPLLVPTRECMVKPGGYLLYTINVDVAVTGGKFIIFS